MKNKIMDEILKKYEEKCNINNDINEHLPTLKKYTEECDNVVEMGVRSIVSTWAFLAGKPKKLTSLDIIHPSKYINHDPKGCNLDEVERLSIENNIDFKFILGSSLDIDIEECDLLFIDTLHTYNQLKEELKKHSIKVKKYIILHDTETFKLEGEDKKDNGIWFAVEEFLKEKNNWIIEKIYTNNNGLTILKKII